MKYDRVIEIELGSDIYDRFEKHAIRNQAIEYRDQENPASRGKYNIVDAKEGATGHVRFYLKKVA
jgi:hypothetical protein